MRRKKLFAMLMVGALTCSSLMGCGKNETKDKNAEPTETTETTSDATQTDTKEKVTLSIMCHASWGQSDAEKAMFALAEEKCNVKLEFETVPDGDQGEQIIQTRYASGEAPDILLWQPASYVKGRVDLSNFIDVSGDWQQYYDANSINTPSYTQDGTVYGAPWGDSTLYGMCYNKTVFADLGIEIPTTWNDLYTACDKIKAANITPVFYSGADAWTLQIMALDGFGQQAIGQDFNEFINKMDTNQLHWADLDVAKAMLDRSKDLVTKGYVQDTFLSDTYQDATTSLIDGTAAMYPHATWFAGSVLDTDPEAVDNIGFFAIPTEDGSEVVTMANPNAMYVSSESKNIDRAKEVINFLASKEALTVKYQTIEGIPFIQGLDVTLTGINKDAMEYINKGVCIASPVDFTKYTKGPLEIYIQELLVDSKTSEDVLAALDNDFATQAGSAEDENWK